MEVKERVVSISDGFSPLFCFLYKENFNLYLWISIFDESLFFPPRTIVKEGIFLTIKPIRDYIKFSENFDDEKEEEKFLNSTAFIPTLPVQAGYWKADLKNFPQRFKNGMHRITQIRLKSLQNPNLNLNPPLIIWNDKVITTPNAIFIPFDKELNFPIRIEKMKWKTELILKPLF